MSQIHIAKCIDVEDTARVVARALRTESVSVTRSVELAPQANASVWCVLTTHAGDFPTTLDIYPSDSSVEGTCEHELAMHLARELSSDCLISDSNVNPYTWTLVTAGGLSYPVSVETEALDRDELILRR
jgi:hypothetical protein